MSGKFNGGEYKENIYVGGGKVVYRGEDEPYFKIQLDLTAIESNEAAKASIQVVNFKNGPHKLLRLILAPMKEENCTDYKTHSLKVDTWKPDPDKAKASSGFKANATKYVEKRTPPATHHQEELPRKDAAAPTFDDENLPF